MCFLAVFLVQEVFFVSDIFSSSIVLRYFACYVRTVILVNLSVV